MMNCMMHDEMHDDAPCSHTSAAVSSAVAGDASIATWCACMEKKKKSD